MKHFNTISELYTANGFPPPENPLLGLVTLEELRGCTFAHTEMTMGFYKIALKKVKSGSILYGKTKYDHDNGSMSFIRPGQRVTMSDIELAEKGFIIYIHEDFLARHALHSEIQQYSYFDYEVNEALHLSPREEEIIWDMFHKIRLEYYNNQDDFSKNIITTHLDSILKYAERFYKRQFLNRTVLSGKTIARFTTLLKHYFEKGRIQTEGLPTVKHMAGELAVSTRYLSDLLKQETGKTALEHIHLFLVAEAKTILANTDKTVAETAYQLGFEYPPYFSRLFKKEVGLTPTEYREKFLN